MEEDGGLPTLRGVGSRSEDDPVEFANGRRSLAAAKAAGARRCSRASSRAAECAYIFEFLDRAPSGPPLNRLAFPGRER